MSYWRISIRMWTKRQPNIPWKSKTKHFFGGGGTMKCSINKAASHPGLEGLFQHVQKEKVAEGRREKKKKKWRKAKRCQSVESCSEKLNTCV